MKSKSFFIWFAVLYGIYFTCFFVLLFCYTSNIPAEAMLVTGHPVFYRPVFYSAFVLLPVFVAIPVYGWRKNSITLLQSMVLLLASPLSGLLLCKALMAVLVQQPGLE